MAPAVLKVSESAIFSYMTEDPQLVIDYLLTKIKELVHENAVLASRVRSSVLAVPFEDDDTESVIG